MTIFFYVEITYCGCLARYISNCEVTASENQIDDDAKEFNVLSYPKKVTIFLLSMSFLFEDTDSRGDFVLAEACKVEMVSYQNLALSPVSLYIKELNNEDLAKTNKMERNIESHILKGALTRIA